jgi:4-hydroxybenzoate polyprenyltransferase
VDLEIDRQNPRTASRELPRGALTLFETWTAVIIASAVFVVAASELNQLCLMLAPVALAWVFFYSFTKRFTRWSHVVLGGSLAIAPVGGYLAVAGAWSRPWWTLVALATAVAMWVAGFDIFYSLQDIEFDRSHHLRSIPAAVGEKCGIHIARWMHVLSIVALGAVAVAIHAGPWYWVGVVLAAVLLLYEHSLVAPGDLSRLDAAFFTMNGMVSIAFFFFVLVDRLARGGLVSR